MSYSHLSKQILKDLFILVTCLLQKILYPSVLESLLNQKTIKTVFTIADLNIHYSDQFNITHFIYPLQDDDSQNISQFFSQTFIQIEENLQKGSILIHCAAGASRSASIVIAYIMKKFQWEFEQTLKYVQQKRKEVLPNGGFIAQLQEYQKELKSEKIGQNSN